MNLIKFKGLLICRVAVSGKKEFNQRRVLRFWPLNIQINLSSIDQVAILSILSANKYNNQI